MDTIVDFFKPIIAATFPGCIFIYGSLPQINIGLEKLPKGKGCVAMNNLLPFKMEVLPTSGHRISHSVTMMLAVKSHPNWGPEQRNEAQRVPLAWLRLLPAAIRAAGGTILGSYQGEHFINGFDAGLDGLYVSYQIELPDTYDYCTIPPVPGE